MATIVIDLDGTIIDSTKRHYLLLKELLKKNSLSLDFDPKSYLLYKSNGHNNYDYLTKKLNVASRIANKIQEEWINNIESPKWLQTDTLYPDAISFLNKAKSFGYNIVFLTARQNQNNLYKELENLELLSYPNQIIVVQGNKINAFRNIPDNQKTMIGDTEIDYEAAENSNAPSYILSRGFRSPNYLRKLGIEKTYKNLDEIILQLHDTYR